MKEPERKKDFDEQGRRPLNGSWSSQENENGVGRIGIPTSASKRRVSVVVGRIN